MNRYEIDYYDDVSKIKETLKRIAKALEAGNATKEEWKPDTSKGVLDIVKTITDDYASKHPVDKLQDAKDIPLTITNISKISYSDLQLKDEEVGHPVDKLQGNDVPGFEGTLDALHNIHPVDKLQGNLCDCGNDLEDKDVICKSCEDEVHYTYEHDEPGNEYSPLVEYHCGVINDSDWNIRKTAKMYTDILNGTHATYRDGDEGVYLRTKKDCILDYVTNEFGMHGARYTDIIKFAYYLGSPNTFKYSNSNRGYYSCAFSDRMGGHLITGGKDQLVKGINKEGDERYFALSFVESATGYWRYLDMEVKRRKS